MLACHAGDPGSIPGRRNVLLEEAEKVELTDNHSYKCKYHMTPYDNLNSPTSVRRVDLMDIFTSISGGARSTVPFLGNLTG
ncbi:hypothetical protein M513_07598 [Trichuris suis]|uniref:Uncharacterized protein n=1 Tax=Trichuris suis TaxID=68888 RepID=A0A085M2V2_9BILA|nr:hypothetical protein M513_07598 [Trichuris suis]